MIKLYVIFRTDASLTIGTGHAIRCLTLAKALQESGGQILFICREHEGHLCDHIEEQGFAVHRLSSPREEFAPESSPTHAAWLGATWQEDAAATVAAITSLQIKPDWLIVDHYGIDNRWEERLRPLVKKIMVIDDLADRQHDCDLLLDQNLVPDIESRYDALLPENCTRLLGPDYALLQPIYAELHDRIPPREGPIRRILISFGGADSDNLTGRALEAIISLKRPNIEVDVVISNNSPHFTSLEELAYGYQNIHLHSTLSTLAPLMAKADLAIGAAGTTSWERLCLGLPAVVVTLAENQVPIAEGLHSERLVRWLGHKDRITKETIQKCLVDLIEHGIDAPWSQRCHQAVDGRGVNRVRAVLTLTQDTPLQVRHATLADELLLHSWANDPETRQNSFSSDSIPIATHHQWFNSRLRDIEGCSIYILEDESRIPVGQVRFEKNNLVWEIDYSLGREFRGKGLGRSLLKTALLAFREEHPGVLVIGRVKTGNLRSERVFKGLGFKGEPNGGGWRISVCSDSGSWMNAHIPDLIIDWILEGYEVRWAHEAAELPEGDICFYLSYGKIVSSKYLANHTHNLVVHESDLPKGRGWSPLTWQVLEGASRIPVTLFEAAESVDSGDIYLQEWIELEGNELVGDLRSLQANATINLCKQFIREYPEILKSARAQVGEATYYPRRRPDDSQIDPDRTIREQFNVFRVADNDRYPVFFEFENSTFILKIYSLEEIEHYGQL